jgi:hypothetical protein
MKSAKRQLREGIQSRKSKEFNRIEVNNYENARNSNEIFRIDQNRVQLHSKLSTLIDYTHLTFFSVALPS